MGDENPIRTLGDYSKPSHEGYRNTIELPAGNNVVPLRSDTIRLVKTNAHSTDFGKECAVRHFNFPNAIKLQLLECLPTEPSPHGRIYYTLSAQFFPSGRTIKLHNDILMFQQHHGESLSEAWTRFKDLLQKVPHHGIDRWLQIQIFYDHVQVLNHEALGTHLSSENEEEENNKTDETPDNTKMPTEKEMPVKKAEAMNGAENGAGNESIKTPENDEVVEVSGSQPVAYYLKHKINEKLIKD
ncbi:zinc finger, CCHC-type containing protein [Tanacetum coccineum]|uniref:Zinc finger, CCHC-type containing protein n=1 Tax=Tanacetum coccineum TaxID=301880 RepID=A0ABQ4Z331_9ASTR